MDVIKFVISFIGGVFLTGSLRDIIPNDGIAQLIITIIIFGSSLVLVYYLIEKIFPFSEKKKIKVDILSTQNQAQVSPSKITEDLARKILAGRKVVVESGIFEEPITVGTVSEGRKDPITGEISERFYWKDENGNDDLDRPYLIVNLQAMNEEQSDKANRFFDEGEWEQSVGSEVGNLSLRMSPEDTAKHNIARGSIVIASFDYRLNSDDEYVLVCTAISPMKSKAGKNSFRERLAQQKTATKTNQKIKDVDTEQKKS